MARVIPHIFFVCLVLVFASASVCVADVEFTPFVSAGVEYNDNVEEKKHGKGDIITSVTPGASFKYEASRFEAGMSGSIGFLQHVNGVKGDQRVGDFTGKAELEALENFLFFEVSDTFKQVYVSSDRGEDLEDGDSSSDQVTDQNHFRFSPYIETDLLERTVFSVGYTYDRYDYSEESSTDKTLHGMFGDVTHELTEKWKLLAGGSYSHQQSGNDEPTFDIVRTYAGTSYDYAAGSLVFVKLGPSYRAREKQGSSSQLSWEAGVTHDLDKGLVLSVNTSRDFSEDPTSNTPRESIRHTLGFTHQFTRASWNARVTYGDYEQSGTDVRTTVWQPRVGGEYDLTERLTVLSSVGMDFQRNDTGNTNRFFGDAGLRYSLSKTMSGRFSYRYRNTNAPGISGDYSSNVFGVYLDASF